MHCRCCCDGTRSWQLAQHSALRAAESKLKLAVCAVSRGTFPVRLGVLKMRRMHRQLQAASDYSQNSSLPQVTPVTLLHPRKVISMLLRQISDATWRWRVILFLPRIRCDVQTLRRFCDKVHWRRIGTCHQSRICLLGVCHRQPWLIVFDIMDLFSCSRYGK